MNRIANQVQTEEHQQRSTPDANEPAAGSHSTSPVWFWTGVILFFFLLQAVLWTTAIRLAALYPAQPLTNQASQSARLRTQFDSDGTRDRQSGRGERP